MSKEVSGWHLIKGVVEHRGEKDERARGRSPSSNTDTHQSWLLMASPYPGVSTTVSRSFTPRSSISTVDASICTVLSIFSAEAEAREQFSGRRAELSCQT